MTDAAGATQQAILYDVWGNERDRIGASANRFTFTGHEKDEETGLIYAKARFYDPDIGGCVPRSVEKERRPPLRHQSIISGGNLRVFENLAQTLVAVDAS